LHRHSDAASLVSLQSIEDADAFNNQNHGAHGVSGAASHYFAFLFPLIFAKQAFGQKSLAKHYCSFENPIN
jgi:hypothetical protein